MPASPDPSIVAAIRESPGGVVLPFRAARVAPPSPGLSGYLTVRDIVARWRCGKKFVRKAIEEMRVAGYLECIFVGRGVRVSLASVERWERQNATPKGAARVAMARLRAPNAGRPALPPSPPGAIRAAWLARRAA